LAREHIEHGADGLVVGVTQDIFDRPLHYGPPTFHPDAARFSVICIDAVLDPRLGKNITPQRLARLGRSRQPNGLPVSLETNRSNDGFHINCWPEYNEFTAVCAWNEIGVASMIFRLEENLRRSAAGDRSQCGMHRELWSNIIGRNRLQYAIYMVSTIHT
jgi:hypothetical protein